MRNCLFRIIVSSLMVLVSCSVALSQLKGFSFDEARAAVLLYHPIAKQAFLLTEAAKANKMNAFGAFDPSLSFANDRKRFDEKNYYNESLGELKIPTWFGVDVKAGVETNTGARVSTELTQGTSNYIGVSVPILKDLFFDKRRADLQQSRLMVELSEEQRAILLNDLLFDFTTAYWDWAQKYAQHKNVLESLAQTKVRYSTIVKSFMAGDRAGIDTIEALLQLQTIETQEVQLRNELIQSKLTLSTFLWSSQLQPIVLEESVIPSLDLINAKADNVIIKPVDSFLNIALQRHPKLRSYDFKIRILKVDERLKRQNLLPTLRVQYNFLNNGLYPNLKYTSLLFENNFKTGIQFSVPLFQRQARAGLQQIKVKLMDQRFEKDYAQVEVENKVRNYHVELQSMLQQVEVLQLQLVNSKRLLAAEEMKFALGENNLFIVNAREMKLLEVQLKYLEKRAKLEKAKIALQLSTGLIE